MQFKIGDMVRTRTKDSYNNLIGPITGTTPNKQWYVRVAVRGTLMELPYESDELRKHININKIIAGCLA